MKDVRVPFEKVMHIFIEYEVFSNRCELHWYRKAWGIFNNEHFVSFDSSFEKNWAFISAFTLIMIYKEFWELNREKFCEYRFDNWREVSELNLFWLGMITDMEYDAADFIVMNNDYEAIEYAFSFLVENNRKRIIDCLVKNMKKGYHEVYAGMLLARSHVEIVGQGWHVMDFDGYDSDIDLIPDELADYKKYEMAIQRSTGDIIADASFGESKSLSWLLMGTYRLYGQI